MVLTATQLMLGERISRQKAEQLLDDLRRAYRQFQSYAAQALATTEERNHLAREIHDGLGHYLTVINVQLEKALAFRNVDPAEADQAVYEARRMVSEALQEVRGTLGALASAPDRFDLTAALKQLVLNIGNKTQVDLWLRGSEAGYPTQALLVLYRVAQEALTNVQKHAGASRAQVDLNLGADAATLDIVDDGVGFDVPSTANESRVGAGYGLRDMLERVELFGGELAVASAPGLGTSLRVRLPRVAGDKGSAEPEAVVSR
jgi:signal transduction histidine kinase